MGIRERTDPIYPAIYFRLNNIRESIGVKFLVGNYPLKYQLPMELGRRQGKVTRKSKFSAEDIFNPRAAISGRPQFFSADATPRVSTLSVYRSPLGPIIATNQCSSGGTKNLRWGFPSRISHMADPRDFQNPHFASQTWASGQNC